MTELRDTEEEAGRVEKGGRDRGKAGKTSPEGGQRLGPPGSWADLPVAGCRCAGCH